MACDWAPANSMRAEMMCITSKPGLWKPSLHNFLYSFPLLAGTLEVNPRASLVSCVMLETWVPESPLGAESPDQKQLHYWLCEWKINFCLDRYSNLGIYSGPRLGWDGEINELFYSGAKVKRPQQLSKINNILMQHFLKIKIDIRNIHHEKKINILKTGSPFICYSGHISLSERGIHHVHSNR